jgi:outer membrane protein assembly factor BamB
MYRGDLGGAWRFPSAGPPQPSRIAWTRPLADYLVHPVISRGLVLVLTGNSAVSAFDVERGTERWTFPIQGSIQHEHWAVAAAGDAVVFGDTESHVYAVDIRTGSLIWRTEKTQGITEPALVAGGLVFVSRHPNLYVLDALSGRLKWKLPFEGIGTSGALAFSGGILCVRYFHHTSHICAVHAASGKKLWDFDTDGYIDTAARLVAANQYVYYSHGTYLHSRDLRDGKDGPYSHFRDEANGTCIDGPVGYVTAVDGFRAYDLEHSAIKWTFTCAREERTNLTGPSCAAGTVYFGAPGHTYALDGNTGEVKWRFQTERLRPGCRPVIADNRVFLHTVSKDGSDSLCVVC